MVDDSLEHALDCSENGIKVLLFNQPWNQNGELPKSITRVYNWKEVLDNLL